MSKLLDDSLTDGIGSHLTVLIAYIDLYVPALKDRCLAEKMKYENRQYHYDSLSGMSTGLPFVRHVMRFGRVYFNCVTVQQMKVMSCTLIIKSWREFVRRCRRRSRLKNMMLPGKGRPKRNGGVGRRIEVTRPEGRNKFILYLLLSLNQRPLQRVVNPVSQLHRLGDLRLFPFSDSNKPL